MAFITVITIKSSQDKILFHTIGTNNLPGYVKVRITKILVTFWVEYLRSFMEMYSVILSHFFTNISSLNEVINEA
jgi:hypothetical protein